MSDDFTQAFNKTLKGIQDSDVFLGITTNNYLKDPYCALQIGIALLLGKPIVLLVEEGTPLPHRLSLIARDIVYFKDRDDIQRAVDELVIKIKTGIYDQ